MLEVRLHLFGAGYWESEDLAQQQFIFCPQLAPRPTPEPIDISRDKGLYVRPTTAIAGILVGLTVDWGRRPDWDGAGDYPCVTSRLLSSSAHAMVATKSANGVRSSVEQGLRMKRWRFYGTARKALTQR